MKEFRVMYWGQDGRAEFMEFDSMEQAQAFYDSLGGEATIQRWDPELSIHIDVLYPVFEY